MPVDVEAITKQLGPLEKRHAMLFSQLEEVGPMRARLKQQRQDAIDLITPELFERAFRKPSMKNAISKYGLFHILEIIIRRDSLVELDYSKWNHADYTQKLRRADAAKWHERWLLHW